MPNWQKKAVGSRLITLFFWQLMLPSMTFAVGAEYYPFCQDSNSKKDIEKIAQTFTGHMLVYEIYDF